MKCYASGPMRNRPKTNFPAFDEVKRYGESCTDDDGTPWVVFSPADHDREVWPGIEQAEGFEEGAHVEDGPPGFTFPELLVWDMQRIAESDAIVLLPGWETSVGARLELHIAEAFEKMVLFAYFEGERCVDFQQWSHPNVAMVDDEFDALADDELDALRRTTQALLTTEELVSALRARIATVPGLLPLYDKVWVGTAFSGVQ